MSEPPPKPAKSDVCRWCLTLSYENCGWRDHWRLITEEYEKSLARWRQMAAERRVEKPRPRASRPILLVLPPGVREWLAELGRRGGSSRSERKQAASRLNGQRGGRPRHFVVQENHNRV